MSSRPGAQFCTVCGSQVGDDGRRTAPVAEEQVPAPAPQPTVPSGVYRESSLPGYPPGQGCGHELRPGGQFCTVCGSQAADDGRRTALVAEEQVPAPGPEATAIRPVPARAEPVTPTSPATVTGRPSERSSDGGVGSGPQRGGQILRPGAMPSGSTTPRQDRRHRSRWPLVVGVVALLAAGGAATVFIVQPFQHGQAAAGTPRTSPSAPRQPLSASATATPSSAAVTPSSPSAQQAAASLAGLLAQSVTDRSSDRECGQRRQPVRADLEQGPAGPRKCCRSAPAPALPAREPSRAFRAVRADASGADRRLAGVGYGGSGFRPMGSR